MISKEVIGLRKELHKYPELSGCEFETARRIRNFIDNYHPTKIIDNIGGAGLAAIYEYSQNGPVIAIRCELDALPIEEENEFDHRSVHKQVSHKCGHDGHMAIVAGLILWIKEQSFKTGKIVLLFQPSEENGKGAERVMTDEQFQELQIDYMFALHNIPQEPMHAIITMDAGFSAEVQSFIVRLTGKESHAAEPENGINPSVGIANIIKGISTLNHNYPQDEHFAVLTPVHINMGQISYGISPSHAELHYTIRTWSTPKLNQLKSKIEETIEASCVSQDLDFRIEWLEYFPASQNNNECNEHVLQAARENELTIIERSYPFKFGEDFGWFTKKYKTAMFGLGAGITTPALHNSQYDFPDDILETGIEMFTRIINNILTE